MLFNVMGWDNNGDGQHRCFIIVEIFLLEDRDNQPAHYMAMGLALGLVPGLASGLAPGLLQQDPVLSEISTYTAYTAYRAH